MDSLDLVMLSRVQFAANMTFHILFPTITIALAWFLLFFKIRFNKTHDEKWMDAYRFFVKVFALNFAMGVVTGITMSFQFGTNWPGYMEHVGNIAGPLLAYEVLTAFFLEASFLGIMLYGRGRVPDWVHTLATVLVAVGTTFSAFWIIALDSWMQTPQGYHMIDGVAYPTSWLEIIFNPSMPYRLTHMLIASGLTASFLIAGLSAYQWLKNDRRKGVLIALKTGVYAAAFLIPLQMFVGDMHGINTLEHQPQKIAAMEGIWKTETGPALRLFAIPNAKEHRNDYEISIPKLSSLILTHSLNGTIKGIDSFGENHPPVLPLFFSFRIMVGMGLLMLLVSWVAAFQIFKRGEPRRWVTYGIVGMVFSGWVATIAGWYTTEIGRQPWLAEGILKTADAVGPTPAHMVLTTLIIYLTVYVFLFTAFVTTLFYLARKAKDASKDRAPLGTRPGVASSRQILEEGKEG